MAAVYMIGLAVLAISDASAKVGSRGPWSWRAPDDAVYDQLHRPLQAITLVVFAMAFVGGLFVGRTIARWVVVVFLPPRLRAPWSFLWITDRKPLPRH